MAKITYIFFFLLFTFVASTSRLNAQQKVQKGRASYYSKRATGTRTSNGERLHHDSLTCAHRTYPFGTLLKVTNPANGKSVVVRVTDRGPFHRGRIIDLSYRAANEIGMLAKGVAMVVVEPYNGMNVPFKPTGDEGVPEFDFEQSPDDIDELGRPAWQEMRRNKEKQQTSPPSHTSTTKQQTKPSSEFKARK